MPRTRAIAAALALALAGCTVGPDYRPPEPAVPATFAEPQPGPGATVDPARWWTVFHDPVLTRLVERALAGNPSIAQAASRVRQARLQEIAARAVGRPTVNAQGNVTHIEFSRNAGFSSIARLFGGGGGAAGGDVGDAPGGSDAPTGGVALPGSGITTYAAGFDASWELDVFGRGRRGVEAALAETDAAVWSGRDAAVMIAAEVADAYLALRTDRQQIAILEDEIARQQRALDIAGNIARVGLVPQIDVVRQRSGLSATRARVPQIEADAQVRIHALGLLLGLAPGALSAELARPLPELGAVPDIPAGLPSDLLRRRPDIRAAERRLAASTARIGVATADLYPRFSLTGLAQLVSTSLATLVDRDSLQLQGSGSAMFPVLDWGRRQATVDLREEDRTQAYLDYQATVLQALKDVEDALARIAAERQRNRVLAESLGDAAHTARAVEAQYRTGFVAQDQLLNAQVRVLSARESLAISDAQLRQQTAALFKAIGGGWSMDELAAPPPPPAP